MKQATDLCDGYVPACDLSALVPNSGIALLLEGQQIALYYLPNLTPELYALGNFDPIGEAHVLSRGILGDVGGRLCVASPLYKQHFELSSGVCIEQPEVSVPTYEVQVRGQQVWLRI